MPESSWTRHCPDTFLGLCFDHLVSGVNASELSRVRVLIRDGGIDFTEGIWVILEDVERVFADIFARDDRGNPLIPGGMGSLGDTG